MSKWQYQGDRDVLGYGGAFFRNIGGREWIFVRFENTEENDFEFHYDARVSLVDLDAI